MHKLLLLLAFAATAFAMPSCTKNDDDSETTESRLTGVWTFVKADYTDFVNGASDSYTEAAMAGDYFDFRNDGTLLTRVDGDDDTSTWRLDGDSALYMRDDFDGTETLLEIRTLTTNALVLYSKETNGADYYEVTAYLSR